MKESESKPIAYARSVYQHNLDWYKSADTKAEIVLALDGVFLAFVTGSIFIGQAELRQILQTFSWVTWLFLVGMSICLVGSIMTAILCLWSRISMGDKAKQAYLLQHEIEVDDFDTYIPEATFFFQQISWLDPELYQQYLQTVDDEFEFLALTSNIHALSKNVLQKHRYVDWSFVLAGGSLISFFAIGITYILAV